PTQQGPMRHVQAAAAIVLMLVIGVFGAGFPDKAVAIDVPVKKKTTERPKPTLPVPKQPAANFPAGNKQILGNRQILGTPSGPKALPKTDSRTFPGTAALPKAPTSNAVNTLSKATATPGNNALLSKGISGKTPGPNAINSKLGTNAALSKGVTGNTGLNAINNRAGLPKGSFANN